MQAARRVLMSVGHQEGTHECRHIGPLAIQYIQYVHGRVQVYMYIDI